MEKHKNYKVVMDYTDSIISKKKLACKELIQMAHRFKRDLKNEKYEFNPRDAEFVIGIIESTYVHDKGEDLQGVPFRGRPFLLQPWQKFIIYNLLGFYHKGTILRKYKEAFIMLPRKNGKTRFISALSWALALLERASGSSIYIVGAALKQAVQSFDFMLFNLRQMGEEKNFRVLNNNQERSISGDLGKGHIYISALAGNPETHDSLSGNILILDELHAYKSATQYNVIKESGKAYANKLCIGITTAGDNMNTFCYRRMVYCQKILDETVTDEQYFVFIAKADEDSEGNVDYTSPEIHEKANPNYNVTIRPDDILNDSLQAQNDPQQRKDFLAKSLNIYTTAMKAYFNIDDFKNSDKKYNWTIEELSKLPIHWYGGADLSKMHDLSATALYGSYGNIDITITHGFFPRPSAYLKADEDGIPLFGWEDDGWLTMSNSPVVEYEDIIKWFVNMRKKGFNIKQIGFDRKFAEEFVLGMKKHRFNIIDEPQLVYNKSQGFRRIERKVLKGQFYYLGSQAYEYCVQNVRGIERADDMIKYEKTDEHSRIDLYDASVFASVRMLRDMEKKSQAKEWLNS